MQIDLGHEHEQHPPLQGRVVHTNYSPHSRREEERNRTVTHSLMMTSLGMFMLILLAAAISKPADYISNYIYSDNYYEVDSTTAVSLDSLSRLQAIAKLSKSNQISSVYIFVPSDLIHTTSYPNDNTAFHHKLMYIEQVVGGLGSIDNYYDSGLVTEQKIVKFTQKDPRTIMLTETNQLYRAQSPLNRDFPDKIITLFPIVEHTKKGVLLSCDVFGNQTSTVLTKSGYYKDTTYTSIIPTTSKQNMLSFNISSGYYRKSEDMNSVPYRFTTRTSIIYTASQVDTGSTFASTGCSGGEDYIPRIFHPRGGVNEIVYYNESADLFQRRDHHRIQRHHITRNQTNNVMPIVFHVDSSIPEPFLSAAIEGIGWGDAAFQYAGFPAGTFKALTAPKDMDPFGVEDMVSIKDQGQGCIFSSENFVHWIHREYRGYSVGQRITDPEDGRVLKGHVRLESLRMRQDVLIASSVLIPRDATDEQKRTLQEEITKFVVQRVRVLAAHEVGHSLGLAHNFAGSTLSSYSNAGSSVMDYPPPLFVIDGDRLKLNANAYMSSIGNFDKVAIDYAYRQFDVDADFDTYLQSNNMVDDSTMQGLSRLEKEYLLASERISIGESIFGYIYLNDQDVEKSDWRDSKWDQGAIKSSNLIESLEYIAKIRRMALTQLHTNCLLPTGVLSTTPLSSLMTESLPIVLLLHRYEVKSVSKLIGGYSIDYNLMNGDTSASSLATSSYYIQFEALQALLKFLTPDELEIPSTLIKLLEPLAFGYESNVLGGIRDGIHSRLLMNEYDGIACIEIQVQLIFENLLDPKKIERLVSNNNVENAKLSINSILGNITETVVPSFEDEQGDSRFFFIVKAVPLYMYFNTMLMLVDNNNNVGNQQLSVIPQALINRQIDRLIDIFQQKLYNGTDTGTGTGTGTDGADDFWSSLYQFLANAGSKRQPFMDAIVLPAGPPI